MRDLPSVVLVCLVMVATCDKGETVRQLEQPKKQEHRTDSDEGHGSSGPQVKRMHDFQVDVQPIWRQYCESLDDREKRERLYEVVAKKYLDACGQPLLSSGKVGCEGRPWLQCQGKAP